MVSPDIIDYIKQNLAKGFTKEQITQTLLASGNSQQDVEEGFNLAYIAEQSMIQTQAIQQELNKTIDTNASTTQNNSNNNLQGNLNSGNSGIENQNTSTNENNNKTNNKIGIILLLVVALVIFGFFFSAVFLGGQQQTPIEQTQPMQNNFEEPESIIEPENEKNISENSYTNNDKIHDSCRINANEIYIELKVGTAKGIIASGYMGDISEISWEIEDDDVGLIMPPYGSATTITGRSSGETRIILTDNSIGPECNYAILVNVN